MRLSSSRRRAGREWGRVGQSGTEWDRGVLVVEYSTECGTVERRAVQWDGVRRQRIHYYWIRSISVLELGTFPRWNSGWASWLDCLLPAQHRISLVTCTCVGVCVCVCVHKQFAAQEFKWKVPSKPNCQNRVNKSRNNFEIDRQRKMR